MNMVLFPRRRARLSGGGGRGWRSVALLLVFAAALYGFWKNAEHQMQVIGQSGAIMDETGSLTGEQLDKLRKMAAAVKESYDLKITVIVGKGEIKRPRDGEGPLELFIAVVPGRGEVVMSFSPLLRRGLGEDFCSKLQYEVLETRVREAQVFYGLADSLTRLRQRLDAVSR